MAEYELPSTDTLRRSALNRSMLRGARVARRRVALRWLLWGSGLLLRWALLPALLVAAVIWIGHPGDAVPPPRPAASPSPQPSASPATEPGLRLRLDDADTLGNEPTGTRPQAQSPRPIAPDRSSRER